MAKVFASKLTGKTVVSDHGTVIGKISDLTINKETGRIKALLIDPERSPEIEDLPRDDEGHIYAPFSAVNAVRDVIVVREEGIRAPEEYSY